MKNTLIAVMSVGLLSIGCADEGDQDDLPETPTAALIDGNTCQEFWDGNNFETAADLDPNLAITGVGARENANEDVTTIRLQARNNDGDAVLGIPLLHYFGSAPNVTPEVWCPVPTGHLATGIAASANGNHSVSQIIVYSRQYDSDTHRLVGEELANRCGPERDVVPERRVVAQEHAANFEGDVDAFVMTVSASRSRGALA